MPPACNQEKLSIRLRACAFFHAGSAVWVSLALSLATRVATWLSCWRLFSEIDNAHCGMGTFLPLEVVECIAARLSGNDRALFLSSCSLWYALSSSSPRLWPSPTLALRRPEHWPSLAVFLHRRRYLLSQLAIRICSGCHSCLMPFGGLAALLQSLAGSPLEALSLAVGEVLWIPGAPGMGSWLEALPSLHSLHIESSMPPTLLSPASTLAQLSSLTFLSLSQTSHLEPFVLPPALLPPRLAVLQLAGTDARGGPLSLDPLPPTLRQLHLSNPATGLPEDSLARLPSLQGRSSLGLEGCRLTWVPRQVSTLTTLQELSLAGNPGIGPHFANPLYLRALTRLSKLDLSGCLLASISPGVVGLPGLKDLRLAGNQLRCPSPLLPGGVGLEYLSLDLAVAFRWQVHLVAMPSLQTLKLTSPMQQGECRCVVYGAGPLAGHDDEAMPGQVGRDPVVDALSRLPAMREGAARCKLRLSGDLGYLLGLSTMEAVA